MAHPTIKCFTLVNVNPLMVGHLTTQPHLGSSNAHAIYHIAYARQDYDMISYVYWAPTKCPPTTYAKPLPQVTTLFNSPTATIESLKQPQPENWINMQYFDPY